MKVKINGKEVKVKQGTTILGILGKERLSPAKVVVEYNKEIVPGDRFGDIYLADKDSIEILSFVGGG